jgi:hypothetical protein
MRARICKAIKVGFVVFLLSIVLIQNTTVSQFVHVKSKLASVNDPEPHQPTITVNPTQDPDLQTKNMIFPTVLWDANRHNVLMHSKASGVLVKRDGIIYVITTRHSLSNEDQVLEGLKEGKLLKDLVNNNIYRVVARVGNTTKNFGVEVVYVDEDSDFLIAKLLTPPSMLPEGQRHLGVRFPLYTAKIATHDIQYSLKFFTKVTVIGYPGMVRHPIISKGVVSSVGPGGMIGVNAPIAPGSSGGPVYHSDTHEIIGIISSVYTMRISPTTFQVLTHMGRIVSITDIQEGFEKYLSH